jgi:hypothetical protein
VPVRHLAVPDGHYAGDSVGHFEAAAAVVVAVAALAPAGVAQVVPVRRLKSSAADSIRARDASGRQTSP